MQKPNNFSCVKNSTKSSKWQYGKSQICLLCFTEYRKKNASEYFGRGPQFCKVVHKSTRFFDNHTMRFINYSVDWVKLLNGLSKIPNGRSWTMHWWVLCPMKTLINRKGTKSDGVGWWNPRWVHIWLRIKTMTSNCIIGMNPTPKWILYCNLAQNTWPWKWNYRTIKSLASANFKSSLNRTRSINWASRASPGNNWFPWIHASCFDGWRLFYKINDGIFVVSVCTTQKWQQIGSIRVSGIEWLKATFLFSIVEFQGADFLVSTCKMMIDSIFKNSFSVFSCYLLTVNFHLFFW